MVVEGGGDEVPSGDEGGDVAEVAEAEAKALDTGEVS